MSVLAFAVAYWAHWLSLLSFSGEGGIGSHYLIQAGLDPPASGSGARIVGVRHHVQR